MNDFPKWLNTKQDYINCLKDYPDQTKAALKDLLDSRFSWVMTKILDGEGITDDTHKVIETESECSQYELLEDSNARMFQLGFTVEEIEGLIQ
jgi:hypothetical protein